MRRPAKVSKTDIPAVIFVSSFVSRFVLTFVLTFVIRDMHHIRLPVVCSENRPKAGKTVSMTKLFLENMYVVFLFCFFGSTCFSKQIDFKKVLSK